MEYDKILENILGRKEYLVVGKKVVRADGIDKALGLTKYTTDYIQKSFIKLKIHRSTHPHAIIKKIDVSDALKVPGVLAVLTANDILGENQVGYAVNDQPLLNDKKVRYIGDPIAIVCAEDELSASEGNRQIHVEYEPIQANITIDDTLKTDSEKIHENGNIVLTTRIRKGDIENAFTKAESVVEDTFETPYQDHMYIEPDAVIAIPEGIRKITIIGAMQSPFLVREKVANVLGWSLNQVRVIQAYTGGAFGGKDDTGPILGAKAALVAMKLRKPTALVLDREEVAAYTPKRFPTRIYYKLGADREGKLITANVKIILDCGAYANRAPYWLWRQTVHAGGPYEIPNLSVDGIAVYTNKVFGGSFRGFGNVAMHFPIESQMDRLANKLGMDPVEFRLKNILKVGRRTASDQLLEHSVGLEKCIQGVVESSDWTNRKEVKQKGNKVRGIGIGCAHHGISTSRGAPDWSAASVILNEDGSITYRTTICELGQGTPFGHAKIIAEILGAPLSSVSIEIPDTDTMPNARPTHGSRGLTLGGTAAADAAIKLRENMVKAAAKFLECDESSIILQEGKATVKEDASKVIEFKELAKKLYTSGISPAAFGFFQPPRRFFDPETGLGISYPVYSFAATVAEIEIDVETGLVDILKIWPAMDVGKIIDPLSIDGQIHGAISQGIGFALMEDVIIDKGKILNPNFSDYIMQTSLDIPEVAETILVEEPYKYSAFGAKGVGEAAIISIVPAITNAIYNATGISFNNLPITPNHLYLALKRQKK